VTPPPSLFDPNPLLGGDGGVEGAGVVDVGVQLGLPEDLLLAHFGDWVAEVPHADILRMQLNPSAHVLVRPTS